MGCKTRRRETGKEAGIRAEKRCGWLDQESDSLLKKGMDKWGWRKIF